MVLYMKQLSLTSQSKMELQNVLLPSFMYAVHIRSLTFTSGLKEIVPYEAWTGHKPNVSHLHIFGSLGWAHVPKRVRKGKLESRAVKVQLLG